ncbi:hypothetical protein X741_27350 [Mesorhizobium sp. LNHC229A00]|nr:hypothetical protein X741_27350 [Mesorhizobium sp. LNHC229A00]
MHFQKLHSKMRTTTFSDLLDACVLPKSNGQLRQHFMFGAKIF